MRNKIQAPGKQVLHKQVPKAQALQKEKDPRLVAVGGFGQEICHILILTYFPLSMCRLRHIAAMPLRATPPVSAFAETRPDQKHPFPN